MTTLDASSTVIVARNEFYWMGLVYKVSASLSEICALRVDNVEIEDVHSTQDLSASMVHSL